MSRASCLREMLEKKKPSVDKVDLALLDQIVNNVTEAQAILKEIGNITDKSDREKVQNCLIGMKGTSGKVKELALKAKEQRK